MRYDKIVIIRGSNIDNTEGGIRKLYNDNALRDVSDNFTNTR